MMPFVLITSLLGYYSLWFGPQILLELTLAFYVPSIPVLIISGQASHNQVYERFQWCSAVCSFVAW
jgi:hypothetical protein